MFPKAVELKLVESAHEIFTGKMLPIDFFNLENSYR